MKQINLFSMLLIVATMMSVSAKGKADPNRQISIVPLPQSIESDGEICDINPVVYFEDKTLKPLVQILIENIFRTTGIRCAISPEKPSSGLIFSNNPNLPTSAYSLKAKGNKIFLRASSYEGFVHGTASILQLSTSSGKLLRLPAVQIEDAPDYPFRSILLDLARFWHPVHTMKETIDLAYQYKMNYMHLHLSDDQSFTFPSRAFPKLKSWFPDGTRRHYTEEELCDVVEYARVRGITIIPEIDVPSHASSLTRGVPEYFGTLDSKTGEYRSTGNVVNMASEKTYEGLDILLGEVSSIFSTSPYIHIGADEVSPGFLTKLPEYMPYVKKHKLTEAEEGNTTELYAHFVFRMNEIVKKHGKKTIVWEGFHGTGSKNVRIPTEILVMAWNMSYNPPQQLLDNGFTLINCAWKPLYIVPPQNYLDSQEFTYKWDIHEFQHRKTGIPFTKVSPDSDIMGAQICFWEQTYEAVLPALRQHVPVVSERIWNADSNRTFVDFQKRYAETDKIAKSTIQPITIEEKGLCKDSRETNSFTDALMIKLKSNIPGKIRYRLDAEWGQFPDGNSEVYSGPITIDKSQIVSAGLFDADNNLIGTFTQEGYSKIKPAYKYRVCGPVPKGGWPKVPDFSTLTETRTGVLGYADKERMHALNRVVFAKNPVHGHVDTQPYRETNPFALELTGQIQIPKTGTYTFKVSSPFGMAKVYFGDKCVANFRGGGKGSDINGAIEAGTYQFKIEYFYTMVQNRLNIQMQMEGENKSEAFDKFVLPIADWKPESQLSNIPEDVIFGNANQRKYSNLATNKPVTNSDGTQPPNYPENTVDADITNSSGWHCGSSPQWIRVDLEKVYTIDNIKLVTYNDGRRHYTYYIEVSEDGKTYKEVVDMRGNTLPSSPEGFDHQFPPVQARYVRVTMLSNSVNPGVHINEILVYEKK